MKKILSLMCAVMMIISASAAPATKKMQAVKFQRAAAMMQNKDQLQKKNFGALIQDAKMLKGGKMVSATPFRAPQAQQEAINVKCVSWDIKDYGTDGELKLSGENNTYAFYFDLIYGGDAKDLVPGKTYTVADIYEDAKGQYAGVYYGGQWNYGVKELSLVKTIDEKGLVHFQGSCVDSLDAAFTFYYDEEEFVPTGDTVKHVFLNKASLTYSDYFGDWVIKANDSEYGFALDILSENAESPAGNYSSDNNDFDLPYTYVTVKVSNDSTAKYSAHSAKAIVAVNNDTTTVVTDILAENGVVYSFAASYYAPSKKGADTIVATNLVVEDKYYNYFGIVFAEAANEKYSVSINLKPETAEYLGDYTVTAEADGEITILSDSSVTTMYSGAISIASTNDGLALTGKVLCENNIEYVLNLTYTKPAQTREETITIDGLALNLLSGAWQISGYNADSTQYVSLAAYSDTPAGTYTEADLAADYCYIVTNITDSAYKYFNMAGANITVSYNEADSSATVTGTFLGQNQSKDDVPLFTLNLTAKVPAPDPHIPYDEKATPFVYDFEEYTVSDKYFAQYGDLIINATNAEGAYAALDFYPAKGDTVLTPGTYTLEDTEAPMTLFPGSADASGNIYMSFFGLRNDAGNLTNVWFPVSGSVEVSETGVITINALNSYDQVIKVTLGKKPEGVENTKAASKATKRLVNGQLVIEKNGVLYNAFGSNIK